MPLWLAVALPLAAYVVRSLLRGFDFKPDMPVDALVLALYLLVLAAAYFSRRAAARDRDDDSAQEEDDKHR